MIKRYGAFALLAGLAIAVVIGIFPQLESKLVTVALVVLGLAGGALSISSEKTSDFLMASVALMLAANIRNEIANLTSIGPTIEHILENVFLVTAAAALVLAVKTIVVAAQHAPDRK